MNHHSLEPGEPLQAGDEWAHLGEDDWAKIPDTFIAVRVDTNRGMRYRRAVKPNLEAQLDAAKLESGSIHGKIGLLANRLTGISDNAPTDECLKAIEDVTTAANIRVEQFEKAHENFDTRIVELLVRCQSGQATCILTAQIIAAEIAALTAQLDAARRERDSAVDAAEIREAREEAILTVSNERASTCEALRAELEARTIERDEANVRPIVANDDATMRKTLERICNLFDIQTPLQLMALALNNEETYGDILVRCIEQGLAQRREARDIALSQLADLRAQLDAAKRVIAEGPELLKNGPRLLDLVRQTRSQLHEGELISDEEYVALTMIGSASARRLEDYDDLRAQLARCRLDSERLDWLESSEFDKYFFSRTRSAEGMKFQIYERDPIIPGGNIHVPITDSFTTLRAALDASRALDGTNNPTKPL